MLSVRNGLSRSSTPESIVFKPAVLAYQCLTVTGPAPDDLAVQFRLIIDQWRFRTSAAQGPEVRAHLSSCRRKLSGCSSCPK
jgi:hypothetical protein